MPQELNERLHLYAPFRSYELDNDRGVAVWLPPSYNASPERRYPVLYLQDGLSVLDCDPRSGDLKAGVDSWVEKLSERGMMTEIIIVAIDSVAGRDQEYSPAVRGEQYVDFLIKGVKSCIDHNYRTLDEPKNTGIGGWSLGALISLYAAWQNPLTFGKVACLSTCFYDCPSDGDGDMVLRTYHEMLRATNFDRNLRLYCDYGTQEGTEGDISQPDDPDQTLRLLETLQENLLIPEVDYTFHLEQGGRHSMLDWRGRFYRPLVYLFASVEQSRLD